MRQAEVIETGVALDQIHAACQRLQQRGFARAVAPEHCDALAGGDLQSVNAQWHSLVFTVITKLCVLEQIMTVKDLLMHPRFVTLGLSGKFHNAVQPLFSGFHLLPACQHAAQITHRGDHP